MGRVGSSVRLLVAFKLSQVTLYFFKNGPFLAPFSLFFVFLNSCSFGKAIYASKFLFSHDVEPIDNRANQDTSLVSPRYTNELYFPLLKQAY